jgi:ferredoxin
MPEAPSKGYFVSETGVSSPAGLVRLDPSLAPDVFKGPSTPVFVCPIASAGEERDESAVFWQALRRFFQTGQGGGLSRRDGLAPALLAPYYRSRFLGSAYPIWMPGEEIPSGAVFQEGRSWTVAHLLETAVQQFAPGDDEASFLKANLFRIDRIVRQKLEESGAAGDAGRLWDESFQELQKELQVKGVEGLLLSSDLSKLRRALPSGGICIPFSPHAHLFLLSCVLDQAHQRRIADLELHCKELAPRIVALMARLQGGNWEMGDGDTSFTEQLQQLQSALEVIERAAQHIGQRSALLFVGREFQELTGLQWEKHFPRCEVQIVEGEKIFEAAKQGVDNAVAALAPLISSLRTASAALGSRDGWGADPGYLDWSLLAEAEKDLLPPVCVLLDTGTLTGRSLGAFTSCIREDDPVKIICTPVWPDPGQAEIAAVATIQQNAFVCQSTALYPDALLGELVAGIAFHGPAFFQIYAHGFPSGQGGSAAYLHTCAAVEARVFPQFCYNPSKGEFWGSRFELTRNPDSGRDWPAHYLPVKRGKEIGAIPTAWTAIDFLSVSPGFDDGFMEVPPEHWCDALVPLDAFPGGQERPDGSLVPFIWMADEALHLHKVAVAWPLIRQYYRYRDTWRYYQENTGVNNFHVNRAAADFSRQLEELASRDTPEARQARERELQQYAETAVRSAMERLATALLGNDFTALPALEDGSTEVPDVVVQVPPITVDSIVGDEAPANEGYSEMKIQAVGNPAVHQMEAEAWIDTPLCTSCGECVDNYPQVFSYNADKQAYVAAPRGGSFEDIVLAAERCPVHIIHPGTPWGDEDPGLSEWIERARPFQ